MRTFDHSAGRIIASIGIAIVLGTAPIDARAHAEPMRQSMNLLPDGAAARLAQQSQLGEFRMASLAPGITPDQGADASLSQPVRWTAAAACLNETLRKVIHEVAATFGPLTVNSTCRSHQHNAKVGGARRSRHLTGDAADFLVPSNARAILAFLRAHPMVGGLKLYRDGHFHIDTGPRRRW